jgi:hypothetical protein
MTKAQKRESLIQWVAQKLAQWGHSVNSINYDVQCLRNYHFGAGLSSDACRIITGNEFHAINGHEFLMYSFPCKSNS